ncbi:hypothetical protein [uncultured Campylobacter sp.]|uniref:hypothetical protein n=1 Tax=uncultured Campylobacter sp. TaxID=218934 RepID=UPI0026305998|nr:hypothetical protein [uncultured Campylobacter sp.]
MLSKFQKRRILTRRNFDEMKFQKANFKAWLRLAFAQAHVGAFGLNFQRAGILRE